jgi:hypothetical protein
LITQITTVICHPSVQGIWDEAATVGSEQIAASVTVAFAIS